MMQPPNVFTSEHPPESNVGDAQVLNLTLQGNWGKAFRLIDTPNYRHNLPQHLRVVTVDRLVRGVAGEQPRLAVALLEDLDGRLVVEHRRNDVAVLGGLLFAHDDVVAVADGGVDHRVALNLEHEDVPVADHLAGEREDRFDVLLGRDGDSGGDTADKAHVHNVVVTDAQGVGVAVTELDEDFDGSVEVGVASNETTQFELGQLV
jgi:hypothetical protein